MWVFSKSHFLPILFIFYFFTTVVVGCISVEDCAVLHVFIKCAGRGSVSGSLCVDFTCSFQAWWCFLEYSCFLPQTNKLEIRLTVFTKLPSGVCVCACGCPGCSLNRTIVWSKLLFKENDIADIFNYMTLILMALKPEWELLKWCVRF